MDNFHKCNALKPTNWFGYTSETIESDTKRFNAWDRIPSDEEEDEEPARDDGSDDLVEWVEQSTETKKIYYRTMNYGDYVHVVCGTKEHIAKVIQRTKLVRDRLKKTSRPRPIVPDTGAIVKGNTKMYRYYNKSSSQPTDADERRGCIYIGPLPKPKMTGSLEALKRLKALKKCKLLLASKKSH